MTCRRTTAVLFSVLARVAFSLGTEQRTLTRVAAPTGREKPKTLHPISLVVRKSAGCGKPTKLTWLKNTSPLNLAQAVEFYRSDLLALSASLHTQLVMLKKMIWAVRRGQHGLKVKILVGGQALAEATDLAQSIGHVPLDPHNKKGRGNIPSPRRITQLASWAE